jgi:hypothetical protein
MKKKSRVSQNCSIWLASNWKTIWEVLVSFTVCLSVCLYVCLCYTFFVNLSVCLSVCLSVYLMKKKSRVSPSCSNWLALNWRTIWEGMVSCSVCMSVCLFVLLFVCVILSLSICLSVFLPDEGEVKSQSELFHLIGVKLENYLGNSGKIIYLYVCLFVCLCYTFFVNLSVCLLPDEQEVKSQSELFHLIGAKLENYLGNSGEFICLFVFSFFLYVCLSICYCVFVNLSFYLMKKKSRVILNCSIW